MNINSLFVILFFLSLGCAAFFCSAETAFIGMQKLRLQHLIQSGHPAAKRVAKIVEQPEKFLATVLLGINFFETAVATLGTIITMSLIQNENWAVAIATIVITIVTLVFAELIPKSLAVRYGERIALRYVRPLEVISAILYPLVYILNHIGIRFTKLVGESEIPKPTISEEEFRTAISIGEAEGVVEGNEAEMLHKVFEFTDRPVSKIMVPRTEIAWVEQGTKISDFLNLYTQGRYSRFPVYKDNTDNVVGMLHAKDVLMKLTDESDSRDSVIDDLMRPAYFVPEGKRLGELLAEMRDGGHHAAVVVDEFGGIAGMVTLGQLTEEIVGDIRDELTGKEKDFIVTGDSTFQLEGGFRIEDANEELGLNLPSGDYETVAGFILSHLGRIPKQGEHFKYQNLKFVITEIRGMKIEKVIVTREKGAAAS
ncbi:MAG: hemolysin family protein [Dehalococcoidia bacterium]